MRPDGNGNWLFSRKTGITVGVVLILLGVVAGLGLQWGTQMQAFASHVSDENIHWNKSSLDDAFVPRGELEAKLDAIIAKQDVTLEQLKAMQADIWEMGH